MRETRGRGYGNGSGNSIDDLPDASLTDQVADHPAQERPVPPGREPHV
jgi:hypothetical protein